MFIQIKYYKLCCTKYLQVNEQMDVEMTFDNKKLKLKI